MASTLADDGQIQRLAQQDGVTVYRLRRDGESGWALLEGMTVGGVVRYADEPLWREPDAIAAFARVPNGGLVRLLMADEHDGAVLELWLP